MGAVPKQVADYLEKVAPCYADQIRNASGDKRIVLDPEAIFREFPEERGEVARYEGMLEALEELRKKIDAEVGANCYDRLSVRAWVPSFAEEAKSRLFAARSHGQRFFSQADVKAHLNVTLSERALGTVTIDVLFALKNKFENSCGRRVCGPFLRSAERGEEIEVDCSR